MDIIILSDNDIGLIDQQQNIHIISNLHSKKISQVVYTSLGGIEFLITGSHDKLVKVWVLKSFSVEQKPWGQYHFAKKIKRMVKFTNQLLVSDKHGDIYGITNEEIMAGSADLVKKLVPIQSNLAIPKLFERWDINGIETLILSDDYSKIKLFNGNNLDEIFNILIPFEGYLKQIIEVNGQLLFLFKINDEENNNTHFTIKSIMPQSLLEDNPIFSEVFPITEADAQIAKSDRIRIFYQSHQLYYTIQNEGNIVICKANHYDQPISQIEQAKIQSVTLINAGSVVCVLRTGTEQLQKESFTLAANEQITIKSAVFILIQ